MSAATIDRSLREVRERAGGRSRRRAAPPSSVRRSIPVRTFSDWDDPAPGFAAADLVAHSGPVGRGQVAQIGAQGGGQELSPFGRPPLELPQGRAPEEGRIILCDVVPDIVQQRKQHARVHVHAALRDATLPQQPLPEWLQARVRRPGLACRFSCPGIAAGPEVREAGYSRCDPPAVTQPLDWRTPRRSQAQAVVSSERAATLARISHRRGGRRLLPMA